MNAMTVRFTSVTITVFESRDVTNIKNNKLYSTQLYEEDDAFLHFETH